MLHLDIHDAAIQDILGRPDYWAAFGRCKETERTRSLCYEFLCQHPRRLQNTTYKSEHRAPCSVYLHHDRALNTSYYIISSPKNDSRVYDILSDFGIPDYNFPYQGAAIQVASNPFLVHAMASGYMYQHVDLMA